MMNVWIFQIAVLYGLWASSVLSGAQFLPTVGTQQLFISKSEAKQQEQVKLVKRLDEYKKEAEQAKEKADQQLEQLKQEISQIKTALKTEPENEFLSKKLVLLNDHYQALKDLLQAQSRFVMIMQEYLQLLDEYVKDPELKQYYQELGIGNRIAFSFDDLRQIKEKIEAKKSAIELLQQQETNTLIEIKSREQAASALTQQVKAKKDEHEGFEVAGIEEPFDLSEKQQRELANLEFELLATKKDVDDLQLQILEFRVKKIRIKIEIEKLQQQILQEVFARIKQSSIRISEADVIFAKDELEKKRQELNAAKIDMYEPKKEALQQEINEAKIRLDELSKQYNIAVTDELDEWSLPLKNTIDSYLAYFTVAGANEALVVDRLEFDELDAQIALQDQTLFLERIATDIKSSFYKIYTGKFPSEERIFEEIKRYEVKLSDIKADLSQLETKKSNVEAQLTIAKKALENIVQKRQEVVNLKDRIFKGNTKEYAQVLELLNEAEQQVKSQIKILNSIRSIHNDTVLKLIKTEQQIKFTIEELRASSRNIIWDRPEDAISWHGVMNIVPNIETFIRDVRSYLTHFDISSLLFKIKGSFSRGYNLYTFIVYALLWLLFLVVLRLLLPHLIRYIGTNKKDRRLSPAAILVHMVLNFVLRYYYILAIWFSLLVSLTYYIIPDPYPYILFYLASIPLLLFFATRLLGDFVAANVAHDYIFVQKEYQRRWMFCLTTLVYATITIFFFREAFILAHYPKSELPNILKALNIIILQISVIFLLTEELVLSVIPRTNDVWLWIREKVDQYYYLILLALIAIIVMMNPYVGFGKLVLFILSRVIYTLLLIGALFWLHGLVKQWSSALFFQTDQEGVKERFPVAKTWYGLSIIAILFSFMFVGAIIVAKIWQWPERLYNIKEFGDIVEWLQTPVLLQDTSSPISFYTVLQFMLFVLGGFLVATALKRFVLSRIFDVLLVDSGVQNTVTSLMRYLVYLMAVMLGLNAVGLGAQINYMLTALLVGIGIIIKDPAADFFAYFIILVQRPIKIGDYIKIDEEAKGVVRKITPRSVVLRRRNSTMIIVPNSYAVNHTITNWNYIRGFIAFDDIEVTVAYKEDPIRAKELFERILDSSPYVLKNPKPIVRLEHFGPHGYEFMLRGFISSNYTLDQWDIASSIRLQIVKVLREQKMDLAIPIRLVMNCQESKFLKDYATSASDQLADSMEE